MKHTIFVDSRKEIDDFSPTKYFNTVEELSDRAYNRPRKKALVEAMVQGAETDEIRHRRHMKKIKKRRERAYRELNERIEREEKLQSAAQQK